MRGLKASVLQAGRSISSNPESTSAGSARNDAAELQEKTVAFDAKKASALRTVNKLLSFMSRVNALTSRVEALEAQRKADEATQRKLDEEPIELPPDIAEYQTRMRSVGDRRRDASTRRRVAFHRIKGRTIV